MATLGDFIITMIYQEFNLEQILDETRSFFRILEGIYKTRILLSIIF